MRALPSSDWGDAPDPTPPVEADWSTLAEPVAHVFTHFALALRVHHAHLDAEDIEPQGDGEWWPIEQLADAGLPTLFARAAQAVRKEQDARD
jgi:A/G-specific adenine glycosylase